MPGVLDCPFIVAAGLLLLESWRHHQLSTSFYVSSQPGISVSP